MNAPQTSTEARVLWQAALDAASEAYIDVYDRDVARFASDFRQHGYRDGSLVAYARRTGRFQKFNAKPDAFEILARHDAKNGWAA